MCPNMRQLFDIAETGLHAILLNPLRSLVTVVVLVTGILPYLVGIGIAKGMEKEAEASLEFGADLYVTGRQFGRPGPIPMEAVPEISKIDGVIQVTPRIVGEIVIGKEGERAVVLGLPEDQFPAWARCVDGNLPRLGSKNELVIGAGLAQRLGLQTGSVLPPFYRKDRQGERLSRVVGTFKLDGPAWQTNLILTSFESAAVIFDQSQSATDLLVHCRPNEEAAVGRAIVQNLALAGPKGDPIRPAIATRKEAAALLSRGPLRRESIFNLHFVLIFIA